jgi:hypothetical protein
MPWPIKGLLSAAALMVLTSCGVSEEEAVRVKEGQTLGDPEVGLYYCTTLGCPYLEQACVEVFFDYGRSPAVCIFRDVCERLECEKEGRECAIFEGFPGQVKCIEKR